MDSSFTGVAMPQDQDTATGSASAAPSTIIDNENLKTIKVSSTPIEMRQIALRLLAEGRPPSSLGTVLPSLLPGYLRALFLGPMSNIDLYFKPQNANGTIIDVNDNVYIIYFDEWSVEEVMKQAKTTSTANTNSMTLVEENAAVKRVQDRVSRALTALQKKVHMWDIYDAARDRNERAALEVTVTDTIAQQPDALKNMTTYWRTRLDWVAPATGYWFDTAAAAFRGQRLKFIAYAPITDSNRAEIDTRVEVDANNGNGEGKRVKHCWSFLSGTWNTAVGLTRENEKIKRDRNAWLVSEIGRIERERDGDFIMEGLGSILRHLDGSTSCIHQLQSTMGEWSGGVGLSGQKATSRRKIKKQVPERHFGSVEFTPEDGGSLDLESFVEITGSKEVMESVEQEDLVTEVQGLGSRGVRMTPAAPASASASASAVGTTADQGGRQTGRSQKITAGKKTGEKGAKLGTGAKFAIDKDTDKRKHTPNDDDAGPSTKAPSPHGEAPATKKRKTAPPKINTNIPPTFAARKSSRIADKRKAGKDEDVEVNDVEVTDASPAKKQKTGDTADTKDDPAAILPTEVASSIAAAKAPNEIPDSDGPAPLSSPASVTTAQITPHRPTTTTYTLTNPTTTITTSPLPPLTAATRTDLMAKYPFLELISDEAPVDTGNEDTSTSPTSPTSSASSTSTSNNNNNNNQPLSPRAQWLLFLTYFGRDAGVVQKLNRFFEKEDGAIRREGRFLELLKQRVGRIRRVEDGEDGVRRYTLA